MKEGKRFVLIISSIIAVGFLITSLASYFVSVNSLRSGITLNELPLTSDNIYSEIQRDIMRPVFISSLMATDTFLRDWIIAGEKDEERVTKYLKDIKERYHTFTSFLVSDNTRNYYYSDGILKKVTADEARDVWYFRVREMKDDFEINVDLDMANKDMMTMFVNYRVYDYEGNYIGATGVGLTVNAAKILIEKYQEKYNRTIYLVDKDGNVKLSGSTFPQSVTNIFSSKDRSHYADEMLADAESSFNYRGEHGVVHVNSRYISQFGWYLVVEQAERDTTRHVVVTLVINLGICIFVTGIVLVLISVSVSAYQKSIDTLRGIIPICSYCKQIRDDKGYWSQVDAYVAEHTDVEFSHGICPSCMEKRFPGYADQSDDE